MKTNYTFKKSKYEISVTSHMDWNSANDKAYEIERGHQVFENGDIQLVFRNFETLDTVLVNRVFAAIAGGLTSARIVEHPEGAQYNYYDKFDMQRAGNAAARILK